MTRELTVTGAAVEQLDGGSVSSRFYPAKMPAPRSAVHARQAGAQSLHYPEHVSHLVARGVDFGMHPPDRQVRLSW